MVSGMERCEDSSGHRAKSIEHRVKDFENATASAFPVVHRRRTGLASELQ